jgi:antitoxin (DNA-binding transcriptional repressor) of toxin-antitoxin stability system
MSIRKVGMREARQRLRLLLDQVQAGDEIVVLRRGREVGRLTRPGRRIAPLPDLSEFRASVKLRGPALSHEIREARRSHPY